MCAKRGRKSEPAPSQQIPEEIAPLADALEVVCNYLQRCGYEGMVIGGVAVSLRTRSRHTNDIDLVLWCPDDGEALRVAELAGLLGMHPRIKDAIEFARENRVLLLTHKVSGINIDISLGALEYEHTAISRRSIVKTNRVDVPTASVEDLIVFKALARRPQDMQDIRTLVSLHPNVDERYIRKWIDELAFIGGLDDLTTEINKLIVNARAPQPTVKPSARQTSRGRKQK